MRLLFFILSTFLISFLLESKQPEINANDVLKKTHEILKAHAVHKEISPLIMERTLKNYIHNLDPIKNYFLEKEIKEWNSPSTESINQIIVDYNAGNFNTFFSIQEVFHQSVQRRKKLEEKIQWNDLPKKVEAKEFKEMEWLQTEEDLLNRIQRVWALQLKTAEQFSEEVKEKSIQRILKRQAKKENEGIFPGSEEEKRLVFSNILKAFASALDAYTAYFTPEEASQFMIHVQQKMHGIGALLRDDMNGFCITKLVEGGPAALSKTLKVKDRIIAVDGEPVVGLDIEDAVQFIRGESGSSVVLTIIREGQDEAGQPKEEKLEIPMIRGEVILKESRYKSCYEPYGDGVIGYIQLHSFYEDQDHSSSEDLKKEILQLKNDHRLLGLILDLRYNTGGLLTEAVHVTGLFIANGVVVSTKDEKGRIQHLRNTKGSPLWDGPLIILTNRCTASASEIVAQTLQDYNRALVVGDSTFGKGSYQTFTLSIFDDKVDPEGEYKITRGRYYTVSGKTPQLIGVIPNIEVPGNTCESEIGEKYGKYPLEQDLIKASFEEDPENIPLNGKQKKHYFENHQERLNIYPPYMDTLTKNSQERLANSQNYCSFMKEVKKKESSETENMENFGQNDLQLIETYSIMKDLVLLMKEDGFFISSTKKIN